MSNDAEQVIGIEESNWGCGLQQGLRRLKDPTEESRRWSKQSIYRIPNSLATLNPKAYKPEILSIGPYHHGNEGLKTMEQHKHRALAMFLKRWNTDVPKLCEILVPVVQDLKDEYDQLDDPKWEDDNTFLEVMILDGCFILELLHIYGQTTDNAGYPDNDPIFSQHALLYLGPHVICEILMLENQLPLRVLQILSSVHEKNADALTKSIVWMIKGEKLANGEANGLGNCLHILDIYREILFPLNGNSIHRPSSGSFIELSGEDGGELSGEDGGEYIIRSATELKAGLFCGVLELPEIIVDDGFETFVRNMMAYERLHNGTGNDVTFFIAFMDSLIDNTDDVVLLHSRGVLKNMLGSDKTLVNVMNSLSIQSSLDPDHMPLYKVQKQVSAFCKKKLPSWREVFVHNYCRNPLLAVSVAVGILIFALTILQSVYSVISYVGPHIE